MTVFASEDELTSDKVRLLLHWWQAHRAMGNVPTRADFDPLEFPKLMPNLIVADLEREPFRIRYRLVGTKVVEATGYDFTGKYLDELSLVENIEPWVCYYKLALAEESPVFGSSSMPTQLGGHYAYQFGIYPLRNGSDAIERFVAIEDYFDFKFFATVKDSWRPILTERRSVVVRG